MTGWRRWDAGEGNILPGDCWIAVKFGTDTRGAHLKNTDPFFGKPECLLHF